MASTDQQVYGHANAISAQFQSKGAQAFKQSCQTPRIRSYSVNFDLNVPNANIPPSTSRCQDIKPDPSRVFVFIDEAEGSIDEGGLATSRNPSTDWINMPSDRHTMGCDLSFADGHCEHWKWLNVKIFSYPGQPVANNNDLLDLRKVQAALPDPP